MNQSVAFIAAAMIGTGASATVLAQETGATAGEGPVATRNREIANLKRPEGVPEFAIPLKNGDRGWVWVVMREDARVMLYEQISDTRPVAGILARLPDLMQAYPDVNFDWALEGAPETDD